jgi:hypothetical protein
MSETEEDPDQGIEEAQEGAQDGIQQAQKQQGQQDRETPAFELGKFPGGPMAAG